MVGFRSRNTSHAADERLRQIDRELSASDLKEKEKALHHYLKDNPEDTPKILMMCQSGRIKEMQRREIDKNIPDSSTHYRVLASRTKKRLLIDISKGSLDTTTLKQLEQTMKGIIQQLFFFAFGLEEKELHTYTFVYIYTYK